MFENIDATLDTAKDSIKTALTAIKKLDSKEGRVFLSPTMLQDLGIIRNHLEKSLSRLRTYVPDNQTQTKEKETK